MTGSPELGARRLRLVTRLIHVKLVLFSASAARPHDLQASEVYFDQTATLVAMVVAIFSTDHLLSASGVTRKQFGLDRVQVVQKPLALNFHVPVSLVPDRSSGSRVTLPSGIKVILNLAPDGDAAVNGSPVKKVD